MIPKRNILNSKFKFISNYNLIFKRIQCLLLKVVNKIHMNKSRRILDLIKLFWYGNLHSVIAPYILPQISNYGCHLDIYL